MAFDNVFNWIDDFLQALNSGVKQPVGAYCRLQTTDSETSIVADDGSLVSVIFLHGNFQAVDDRQSERIINGMTTAFTPIFAHEGHALQVVFSYDPNEGGVGKTTTTQNLGVSLAGHGKHVLLLDLDAQANLTDACGMEPQAQKLTSFHLLDGSASLKDVTRPVLPGLDLVPANIDLAVAELFFAARMGRESLLRKALANAKYDCVLIDCPPSLGLLTINALTAAQGLLIPVQVDV